ncbi:MAG: hypothetical protein HND53_07610 [Proteobacteria bacterium]|nr:hypothetical protein [Pseudomonadota bacterium]NOG60347.1 hypothetical protein [Pseudomonadota bacterium]
MAAFLGDIAFLIGILVIASGLLVLHKASSDPKPKLLIIAGKLLVIAGILTALCTTYFYFKYHLAGELEHPYPIHSAMMKDMKKMHGQHMDKMMMNRGGMQTDVSSVIEDDEHGTHHPDE